MLDSTADARCILERLRAALTTTGSMTSVSLFVTVELVFNVDVGNWKEEGSCPVSVNNANDRGFFGRVPADGREELSGELGMTGKQVGSGARERGRGRNVRREVSFELLGV